MTIKKVLGAASFIAASALVLTACGSDGGAEAESTGGTTVRGSKVTYSKALHDGLPEDVKKKGKLVFSTDGAAPPRSFVDDKGKLAGVIPELLTALGAKLGVAIDLQKNAFDTEVPGVQSGRYDATTGTGDFPARREVLDMVDYYKAGYLYLVKGGNPKNVGDDPLTQCGLRVGVLKGTTQEKLVTELSDKCVKGGKKKIDLQSFNNVLLEVPLESDRVDVVWENTSTGFKVSTETPEKFAIAGKPIFPAYLGFGISKKRPELRDSLQKALEELKAEGTYKAIFDEWKQTELMMDEFSLNSDVRP